MGDRLLEDVKEVSAFYNENDPYAAQWLRNLIAAGELPDGHVDDRSITDVQPEDLNGYTQVHFFAGIGGWPYALRLAGWPDDRPVWTGSCPCQPLSSAGQRKGHADQRHLWPAFHNLIAECRPATIFGEQVASKDGREWFSAVRADMERSGYACGCADLAAASVGAPHIRQRLFWVADAMHTERRSVDEHREDGRDGPNSGRPEAHGEPGARGEVRGLADAGRTERQGWNEAAEDQDVGWLGQPDGARRNQREQAAATARHRDTAQPTGGWNDIELIPCADGKTRVTQPGLRPLADGVPNRVGRLRAFGNAIVPPLAAEFIRAYMDEDTL